MNETKYMAFFTPEELELKASLEAQLCELAGDSLRDDDMSRIEALLAEAVDSVVTLRTDSCKGYHLYVPATALHSYVCPLT